MADVDGTQVNRSSRSQHTSTCSTSGDKNQQVTPRVGQGGQGDHCQLFQGMRRHMQTLEETRRCEEHVSWHLHPTSRNPALTSWTRAPCVQHTSQSHNSMGTTT